MNDVYVAENLEKDETASDSHGQRGYSSSPPPGEAVVLNSVSSTKTLDNSSATETKQVNAMPIHRVGPKVFSITRGCGGQRQLDIPLILTNPENGQKADIIGMMDTGCTGSCIHRDLVRRMELTMIPFDQPIAVFNADGTPNIGGSLTHYVISQDPDRGPCRTSPIVRHRSRKI